jgi:membrane-bound lytic murein transglycosylase B
MAPFLFGSIEPNASKNRFWFTSALIVLLAGFFSLGLSISPSSPVNVKASNYDLKFKKVEEPLTIVAKPKAKIALIDKKKIAEEQRQKAEAEQKAKESAAAAEAAAADQSAPVTYANASLSYSSLDSLYQAAANAYGLNWRVLAAVHSVESGQSIGCVATSYAGATGPMQFMPSTFNAYAVDGNGDGVADICNVNDAVFTAAAYLAANSGSADIHGALYQYNHSWYYVDQVLAMANSL